jgi:hypothetical protein
MGNCLKRKSNSTDNLLTTESGTKISQNNPNNEAKKAIKSENKVHSNIKPISIDKDAHSPCKREIDTAKAQYKPNQEKLQNNETSVSDLKYESKIIESTIHEKSVESILQNGKNQSEENEFDVVKSLFNGIYDSVKVLQLIFLCYAMLRKEKE